MAKKERTRSQKFLRVLIVIILLTMMGLAAYTQYSGITWLPESVMVGVIGPIQSVFSNAADSVQAYIERIKLRSNIEQAYNDLRAENEELRYRALFAEELQNQYDQAITLLGEKNQRQNLNPLLASVTGQESSNWFSVFTLDKGSEHGVEPFMAVVTPYGLVGQVVEVYPNSCKVRSIIDSNCSIAALIESTRDQGIVRGALGSDGTPTCRIYYLSANSVPRPGDKVLTSGVGMAFPKGLPIGTIRESTREQDDNKYYIVVEPEADFKHIEDVLILRYKPSVEELPAGEGALSQPIMTAATARPQPPDHVNSGDATPEPIPGAPGRATVAPQATPAPNADDGGEEFTPEEQAMRDAWLNDEE